MVYKFGPQRKKCLGRRPKANCHGLRICIPRKHHFLSFGLSARGAAPEASSWPTNLTLEASELPALDLWFAPPLLSSCLLQSCYMNITHGTQHDHTSSSELNRNMFAGALHDNLCGRSRG